MNEQASFSLRGRNPDVLTCIANLSNDEVFTPPERGRVVRVVGVNPRSLRKMVERNEIIGKERLDARRAALAAGQPVGTKIRLSPGPAA